MISESLGAVFAVKSMRHRDSSSLMFSDSLGALWAVESMGHPREEFVNDFRVPSGCLGCRI